MRDDDKQQQAPGRSSTSVHRTMGLVSLSLVLALSGPSVRGQQPPPAPVVQPFNDGADWVLIKPFTYTIGQTSYQVTVPAGFVTDFASIPAPLRGLLSPTGQEGRAAIVHDYLYWEQQCAREQADWILRLGMIESHVKLVTRQAVYWAVRAAGGSAWTANAADRNRGLPRVIPAADIATIPALELWPEFRRLLFERGVRALPQTGQPPAYCAAAMTIEVDDR
jgi:hypothetical protein